MKNLLSVIAILAICAIAFAAAPVVSNVVATPSAGRVNITYDLVADKDCTVSLEISSDGGSSYTILPEAFEGDLGENITPGTGKSITWYPGEDGISVGTNYRAKVIADDLVPEGFVYVEGGTFTMGDTHGVGYDYELPTHSVTLSSFYIGKYEVTQAEFAQYMQPSSSWTSNYGLGDNYSAYYVTWYASLKYCNLRSMAEGLTPAYSISGSTNPANWGTVPTSSNSTWDAAICNWSANGYRLPTEAEWEFAARGATNTPDYLYSGSDDINAVAWCYDNNSPYGNKPVGTKAPNGIGTYDMSGNISECCWDWFSSDYYSSSPSNNPTGPASGSERVVRGGCWALSANFCQVASRYGNDPYFFFFSNGFRVCRSGL
jgi:formylglycine-generating enzyme required for sulfatase activity